MKRYIFRNYFYSLLLFLLAGCSEGFLDKNHPGNLGYDKLYRTESDFRAALTGCYESIMASANNNLYLGELPSDNAYVSRFQLAGALADLDRLGFTAQTGIFTEYWASNYRTIQRVNLLLQKIRASSVDQEIQRAIIAEALFLRGYAYFNLVRVFGGVPLYSEYVDLNKIYEVAKASEEEVFGLIVSDLKEAANIDSYRSTEQNNKTIGRATTVAAKTLLGKVYVWKHDYAAAETILSEILPSGKKLVDLSVLYHPDKPDNEEIIFSINYDRTEGFGSPFAYATVPYNAPQGLVYPNVKERAGTGYLMIEPFVANAFDADDKRKTMLLRETKFDNLGTPDTHIYSMKYIDPNTTFNGLSGANTIILRYADVLLTYAEALNENGKTAQARSYVNQVRTRAGISPLGEGLSKAEMSEALGNERQKEFLLEGDRWFDLRYRGISYLKTKMAAFMPGAYLEQNRQLQLRDSFVLFPIPEDQIQIKPVLKQNTGY